MWKELQESPSFFLFFQKRCRYHILITDFMKIWEAYYTEEGFLNCLKDSNPYLEIHTQELIEKGTDILVNPKGIESFKIAHDKSILTVDMTKRYGYLLHLKIKVKEGSPELFFQKVTQPLLKTVKDLRCAEHELRKVLLKKDEEIEEYKTLGGKIRYTALPPYSDEVHMQMHPEYENIFGNMEISDDILERQVNNIPTENVIKADIDMKTVKQELMSQETSSAQECTNNLSQIKQETIKTEFKPLIPVRTKRKKTLNL